MQCARRVLWWTARGAKALGQRSGAEAGPAAAILSSGGKEPSRFQPCTSRCLQNVRWVHHRVEPAEFSVANKAEWLKAHRAQREDNEEWRSEWLAKMKDYFWDEAAIPEEEFEQQKLEWLDNESHRRLKKCFELRKVLFGATPWSELSPRQKEEWDKLTDSLAELGTSPDALLYQERETEMLNDVEMENIGRPEDNDFFSDQPWPTPYNNKPRLEAWDGEASDFARPVFNSLDTGVLQKHALWLRSTFTPFEGVPEDHILRFESRQHIELNPTSRTDRRNAKVVLKVSVSDLNLTQLESDILIELVNSRYCPKTDELRLVGNRLPTCEMNREYLRQLLFRLVTETKRVAKECEKESVGDQDK